MRDLIPEQKPRIMHNTAPHSLWQQSLQLLHQGLWVQAVWADPCHQVVLLGGGVLGQACSHLDHTRQTS